MEDEIEDKEDVIEDQNDDIEDEGDTIEDKEDVIEDQNDSIEGRDDAILREIGRLSDAVTELRGEIIAIKDTTAQFVEAGGTIREDESGIEFPDDDTYTTIEDLDLNI